MSRERAGALRIVSIDGLDRSACGGTHVARTGEIGPILLRKLDRIRNTVRVEFLCGARADFDALSRVAQMVSGTPDEAPELVAAQFEAARNAAKLRRKLEADLAQYQSRELYAATAPDEAGVRRVLRRLPSGSPEDLRALAQSFTAQAKTVFIAVLDSNQGAEAPAVLLAVSADSGIDAGKLHDILDNYGIANSFEIYPGTHTSAVAERFQNHVLPFFSKNLCFTPECR